jgi:uncharacterized membrane protein YphA (DoxX/SURF4 family)
MHLPFLIIDVRLFLRLFLGLILLSVGTSKLLHPRRFQQGIRNYQLLPTFLESSEKFLMIVALLIVLGELVGGLGLITGAKLVFAIMFTQCLFLVFSGALIINLVRGRKDLSCHCGGALGNHLISWWLVGRNILLILSLFILLFTPPDPLTIDTFTHSQSVFNITMLVNTVLPVAILVISILLIGILFNTARSILEIKDWL